MSNISKTSEPLLGLMSEQATQQGQQQLDLARSFSDLAVEQTPKLAQAERQATRAQRGADAQDLGALGGRYRAVLGQISPEWNRALTSLDGAVGRAGEVDALGTKLNADAMSAGPSAIRTALERQAQEQLALGSELAPDEIRAATQASRAGYSDRGLSMSNPAVAAEVLARDFYGRQRASQRAQFAQGVQALALNEDQANRGYGMNVEAQNEARAGNARNFVAGAAGVQQNAMAPVLGFFGRSSTTPGMSAGVLSSSPNIVGAGQSAIGPLLGYGSDLYNTNFNSDAATRISNANNMAAIHGAVIGAVGSMAGAATKCWVAREIFGPATMELDGREVPKWLVFRHWLCMRAPRWFRKLYIRWGRPFAAWLSRHDRVKQFLRPWFEERVAMEADRLLVTKPLQNGEISLCLNLK